MHLFHKKLGTGAPIVILHGFLGMSDNWRSVARHLSDNYTVHLLDLPSHGRSDHIDQFHPSEVADLIVEWLEEHIGLSQYTVVGHSLGGKIAMYMALQHEHAVEGMISVDMAPKKYARGHDDVLDALNGVDLSSGERHVIEQQMRGYLSDEDTVQFLMKSLDRTDDGMRWRFDLPTLTRDYENILLEVDAEDAYYGPALFIKGGRSPYIDVETDGELILDFFPRAEILTVANAGHWVHAENPDRVVELIDEFMLRVG